MLKKSLLALLLACSLLPTAWAQSPSKALHQLFEQEWERNLRDRPETASYQGDQRFNDRWSDLSLAAFARREQAERVALRYADLLANNHLAIDDAFYQMLKTYFSEKALVELGMVCALCIGFGRLSASWDMTEDLPERFKAQGTEPITPWGPDAWTTAH